ncbi:MAG: four helix bundle protein [Calditrichaeota bacterium]|nr:four helix bundle protein [Calditrichota bacterium]
MSKLIERIEDMDTWKRSFRLTVEVYKVTNQGDFEKDWGLKDQVRRSGVSIPSNLAEGFERNSPRECRKAAKIAKGSCAELRM